MSDKSFGVAYAIKKKNAKSKYATGGTVEDAEEQPSSIAAAIMAKSKKATDTVSEEDPANAFDELNEDAALKENYDDTELTDATGMSRAQIIMRRMNQRK